jgi:3-phosphoshikimate 1-carboxyvinyltransferase
MESCHDIQPISRLSGSIVLPASKSYTIRAFIIAGCGGRSTIVGASDCDDAVVARGVAKALGARIRSAGVQSWNIEASRNHRRLSSVIQVRESGTVLRFLLPLVATMEYPVTIDGCGTLRGRPNKHLIETLRQMGADIHGHGAQESVPVVCQGGGLRGGKISIEGTLSSQFISALLITCPLLKEDSVLRLVGRELVSGDYVRMTRKILDVAGIQIRERGKRAYAIPGGQVFGGLNTFHVPSDYGLAAFPLAAAVLILSRVTLKGVFSDRLPQADGKILEFLRDMGAEIRHTTRALHVRGPVVLKGGTFSLKNCPDLVPIMAVLGMFAQGRTILKDIAHARAKESDRISDLRHELLKVGADVRETRGSLVIVPKKEYRGGVVLNPHHDHRLAMAFSVLGMKIGVRVKDMDCVAKSYPGFTRDMKGLGASFKKVRRLDDGDFFRDKNIG